MPNSFQLDFGFGRIVKCLPKRVRGRTTGRIILKIPRSHRKLHKYTLLTFLDGTLLMLAPQVKFSSPKAADALQSCS
uniref:Uncharacterized protein n=1 Tax=Caenorhabditis japonica TaxID=281687 RepID=A0A8R1IZV5_CAEJA